MIITLKGSRFFISYDKDSGEHAIFARNKNGYHDVTNSLNDEEKNELINDLIYCIDDFLDNCRFFRETEEKE